MIHLQAEMSGCSRVRLALYLIPSLAISLLVLTAFPGRALAEEKIESFTTTSSTSQAGGHPNLETNFALQAPGDPEAAKDITFNAPSGLFGNTNAITECPSAAFAVNECTPDSQAGVITVYSSYAGDEITECTFEYGESTAYGHVAPCSPSPPFPATTEVNAEGSDLTANTLYHYLVHTKNAQGTAVYGSDHTIIPATTRAVLTGKIEPELLGTAPIYDLVPGAGQSALFAFIVPTLNLPIDIPVAVRTNGDYGLSFTVQDITQLTPLAAASLALWGFPAEETHHAERFPKGAPGEPAGKPHKARLAAARGVSCVMSWTVKLSP